jgi:hypothetical protein
MNLNQLNVRKIKLIFLVLIFFHILLSITMSYLVQTPFFSKYHAEEGLWLFAGDSTRYHKDAIRVLEFLKQGDYKRWWKEPEWFHIRLISAFYIIFGSHPLSFAPVNALIWTLSIFALYNIILIIFPEKRNISLLIAVIFGFWPSYLVHTTQLLKDPFYVLGVLMMLWGWIGLLYAKRKLYLSMLVGSGVILASSVRPYFLEPLIILSIIAFLFVIWRAKRAMVFAGLALLYIFGFYIYDYQTRIKGTALEMQIVVFQEPRKQEAKSQEPMQLKAISQEPRKQEAKSQEPLEPGAIRYLKQIWHDGIVYIEHRIFQIVNSREGFTQNYQDAGSNIDVDVHFHSFFDILKYIPKAMFIGFFYPSPYQWFQKAKTSGPGARIIAGMEMIVLYFLFAGFIYFIFAGLTDIHIKIWLVIYCFGFVLLNALIITNVGALYRVRFIYLLPVFIGGIDSFYTFYRKAKKIKDNT